VTFARLEPTLRARFAFQETKGIILLMALFFLFPVLFLLFFAPVVRLLGARAFSFTISMAFPVSGAH